MSITHTSRAAGRQNRQAAADRNMAELNRECHNAAQTARRFTARGGLTGVAQNSGQAEMRSLIRIEVGLERALSLTRSTRAMVMAERGEEW